MKKYKVYLFDFDGTLFDTRPALQMVFKKSYEHEGVMVSDDQCQTFSREPINIGYQALIGGSEEQFWEWVRVINYYLNSEESVSLSLLFPDTKETHQRLSKMEGIQYGIVTSNNIPHCKEIYHYHHIDISHMSVLVGNHECVIPKPDPAPIQTALKMLNYDGDLHDVVYIGDALNDVLAAKNAGVDGLLLDRDNIYQDSGFPLIHSLLEIFD